MQETRNNCFGSKICSTTLRQAKTDKHECRNITAIWNITTTVFRHLCLPVFAWRRVVLRLLLHFGTRAFLFLPDEGSCYIFSTRNNCCQFLAPYCVNIQSVTQSFLKTPVCGASLTYYHHISRVKNLAVHSFNQ